MASKRPRGQARSNMEVLFYEQYGECFYCKTEMFIRGNAPKKYTKKHRGDMATFDHIIVKSAGGTYAKANGVCACFKCNGMRGDMLQTKFIENFASIRAAWDKRASDKIKRRVLHLQKFRNAQARKKQSRKEKEATIRAKRAVSKAKNCYLIARFAIQNGETVEDLFLEFVYTSTYELARDL